MPETRNESGQALLAAVFVLIILAILGYAALEYGSQTARLTYNETARNVAQHLDSLATQDAITWGNANISFPPGTPTGTIPAYFYNDSCANGSVGCTAPLSAAQVAATSSIWNTAATVSASLVAPLASSFPGATVKWVMEYYGQGLCTISGCSSKQAPTNVCTCYYYRISALTTNNPNNPTNGIAAVTQILYRIPQPR